MQRGAAEAGSSGREAPAHSSAEVQAAWQLLCGDSGEGMTKRDAARALRALQPGLTGGEVEAALGGLRQRMTLPRLQALLLSAPLPKDFDPVLAAFRLIDRDHSGSITEDEVMAVVARLPDIGTLEAEDRNVVMQLLDRDRDGLVSLPEFRQFVTAALAPPAPAAVSGAAPRAPRA